MEKILVTPETFTLLLAKAREWDCTVEQAASRLLLEYTTVESENA